MRDKQTIDVDLILDGTYLKFKEGEKILDSLIEKCDGKKRTLLIDKDDELKKPKYSEYFQTMMKKFGITSIKGLDPKKKKEFFDAVDKGWKGKKESD